MDKTRTIKFTGGWCLPLALIFVLLKVTEQVDWSWLWVLSPIWLPFAAVMGAALAIIAATLFLMLVALVAAVTAEVLK